MSKIQNKPVCREAYVEKVRGAMHHRAQWLYLLLDEAKKRGADWEEIARAATSRCGCFQGAGLYEDWTDHTSLKSFAEVFADEDFKKYFDMEIVESTESSLQIKFHHCPLVAGWQAICALPGFVDSKNEEKTERNAGYLVVSQSGGGMLRQGTRKGIRRTPANRGMRAHRIVKGLDISEDVCHGMCP